MLEHLSIRDFAIVEKLDIEFAAGMTALTGETGAGKSILLGALGLVLGNRADAQVVKAPATKSEITASFDITQLTNVQTWLETQDLQAEDECILRRVISSEGRSRAFINNRPVTLPALRELGAQLVSIHGQHEHQRLTQRQVQRERLDSYAGLNPKVYALAQLYQNWQQQQAALDEQQQRARTAKERLTLLTDEVAELTQLNLQPGEWQKISEQHQRLAAGSRLIETTQLAVDQLYEGDNTAYSLLSRIQTDMAELVSIDSQLEPAIEIINTALIHVEEAADTLRGYAEQLDTDPQTFAEVEDRLSVLHDTARKFRVKPEQLYEHYQNLSHELSGLANIDDNITETEAKVKQLREQYMKQATKLHQARSQAAKKLNKQITQSMANLSMTGGQFVVDVQRLTEDKATATGLDQVEFLVSANPGQKPQHLNKVASGGELSRISLAIQMITVTADPIPCLIFDEVDAGVGGAVAETVGRYLRELGQYRQVLCVTHLPQVAAQANQQLKVAKTKTKTATSSQVNQLDDTARVDEIARMLGGQTITDATRLHAQEMLKLVN